MGIFNELGLNDIKKFGYFIVVNQFHFFEIILPQKMLTVRIASSRIIAWFPVLSLIETSHPVVLLLQ